MSVPVVVALDYGGSKIASTVADAHGHRLASVVVATAPEAGAVANFDLGVGAARDLLSDVAPGCDVLAVGATSFGNPFDNRVELAPAIAGWGELAFGDELRRAFPGAEVRTANDVKAAALGEATTGALVGCDPGIYVNLGTGLAVAVVMGGAVLSGANGAAGEIGYSLRRPADVDEPAPVNLESAVGGGALDRRAREVALGSAAGLLGQADQGVVDDIVRELAMHLVNLTVLIDPVRIVVGGGMTGSWDLLAPRFAAALEAHTPFPPELVLAANPHEAPLLGALALALGAVDPDHIRTQWHAPERPSIAVAQP